MRLRQPIGYRLTAWLLGAGVAVCLASQTAFAQTPSPQDTGDDTAAPSTNPPSLQLLGYADSSFAAEWPDSGDTTATFKLGEFDLFFTSTLGPDWSALAEVVFETESSNTVAVDLERAVVTYAPRDSFNLSMGRFHSVISYYNSTFPHASWYQVAANRPFSQDFEDEGGLLPSHGVGVSVSGRAGGPLRPRFSVELTNGVGADAIGTPSPTLHVQGSGDQNNRKSVVGALQLRPVKAPGWQLGVATLFDSVGPTGSPEVSERIVSGHLVFQDENWEWITEAYGIRHQLEASAAANSSAIYTQLARQAGAARPFFRYEQVQLSDGDPLHTELAGTTKGPSVGVRFDPSPFVAIKTQFDWLKHTDGDGRKRFVVQASFAF